jgi:hypothetical protein
LPVEEIEVSETLLEDFKFDRTLWADTVNAPANVRRRWGALHYAAYNAHPKVLKLLLEAGADPSCRDIAGELPIHVLNKKYVSAAGMHVVFRAGCGYCSFLFCCIIVLVLSISIAQHIASY